MKLYKKNKIKPKGNFKIFIGGRLYSKMKGTEEIFSILYKLILKINNI